jgi:hypothetical protein
MPDWGRKSKVKPFKEVYDACTTHFAYFFQVTVWLATRHDHATSTTNSRNNDECYVYKHDFAWRREVDKFTIAIERGTIK